MSMSLLAASGCIEYHGHKSRKGYGKRNWDGSCRMAHRVAYKLAYGDVPDDLDIDHLCSNRACVNPAHLEAVTHAENVRRAVKNVCALGHPYETKQNARGRRCYVCHAERERVRRANAKASGISLRKPRGKM